MKSVPLIALLALVACAPPGWGQLGVQRVDSAALHTQLPGRLVIRVQGHGQPLTAAALSVQADMLHPGMPSATGQLSARPDGSVVVYGLNLPMAGDWLLTVSARVGGAVLSGTLPFQVQP